MTASNNLHRVPEKPAQDTATEGWLSRDRSLAMVLLIASLIVGYLCYRLIAPFLPALAWALALAVTAHPLHLRVHRLIGQPDLAAGISVLLAGLLIVAPAIFVTHHVVQEAAKDSELVRQMFAEERWRTVFQKHTALRPVEIWIDTQLGLPPQKPQTETPKEVSGPADNSRRPDNQQQEAVTESQAVYQTGDTPESATEQDADAKLETKKPQDTANGEIPVVRATEIMAHSLASVVTSTTWLVMQLLITGMTTFYFFRDRRDVLRILRSLLPLTRAETDDVFTRINDTIHATLYGSVTVAIVQGTMGGLMFWFLGLPSPLLWGSVMAILAVIPLLGTFVIWMPTAIILTIQGQWWQATVLAVWGAIAIGLIDNLLYPLLVGKRMRIHTLLVFFSIVGGITLFGTSGIILGPLLLASADALLDIWRLRTAFGGTVEKATEKEA